jgi:hypothetical protein
MNGTVKKQVWNRMHSICCLLCSMPFCCYCLKGEI